MPTILAVILLFSHLGAPAHALEMVPLKGDFACRLDIQTSESICHGQAAPVGQNKTFVDSFGAVAWVASNGDTIRYVSRFIDFGEEVSPDVAVFTQGIQIIGGTGSFSNAVGSATLTGTWNLVTGEIDGLIDGTISRPNSR